MVAPSLAVSAVSFAGTADYSDANAVRGRVGLKKIRWRGTVGFWARWSMKCRRLGCQLCAGANCERRREFCVVKFVRVSRLYSLARIDCPWTY